MCQGESVPVVELVGFVLIYDIGEAVPELLVGQGDRPMVVSGIAQDGCTGLEFGERQHTAKTGRIDCDRYGR